jgi:hypothetical protein
MDNDSFDRLVSEDVKNLLSSEKSDFLRLPENRERWKETLLGLIENLDEQIVDLSKDEMVATENLPSHMVTEFKVATDEKKTKINRFRFYVMQKISEAEKLIAMGDSDTDPSELTLAQFLKKAIEEHKSLMALHDFEPTPIDLALWDCMSGEWGFVDMEKKIKNF